MSDIKIEPGTVALRGNHVSILNVGEGDTTLSFDPRNPEECERAAKVVTEMLRLGFAIMVEDPPGSRAYRRVKAFDESKFQYIIGDLSAGDAQADRGTDEQPSQYSQSVAGGEPPAEASAGAPSPKGSRRKRGPYGKSYKRIDAASTRTVSIGRSAGG